MGSTANVGACVSLEFDLAEEASVGGVTEGDKGEGGGRNTATHAIDHLNGSFEGHTTALFFFFLFNTEGKRSLLFSLPISSFSTFELLL